MLSPLPSIFTAIIFANINIILFFFIILNITYAGRLVVHVKRGNNLINNIILNCVTIPFMSVENFFFCIQKAHLDYFRFSHKDLCHNINDGSKFQSGMKLLCRWMF